MRTRRRRLKSTTGTSWERKRMSISKSCLRKSATGSSCTGKQLRPRRTGPRACATTRKPGEIKGLGKMRWINSEHHLTRLAEFRRPTRKARLSTMLELSVSIDSSTGNGLRKWTSTISKRGDGLTSAKSIKFKWFSIPLNQSKLKLMRSRKNGHRPSFGCSNYRTMMPLGGKMRTLSTGCMTSIIISRESVW